MPESNKKFHDFAFQSILFKGRSDWYFCYLKAEKLSQVLALLASQTEGSPRNDLDELTRRSGALPGDIAHLAAGEVDAPIVLADVFGMLSSIRLLSARQSLRQEHAVLLGREYEELAVRIARGSHPSPFLSPEDLQVSLPEPMQSLGPPPLDMPIKDKLHKGQKEDSKGQSDRMTLILELVRKRKSASIKDIAAVIRGCSEKTIQRELTVLIERGLVRRQGERRWSVYVPA